jgi:hypothetical protein
MQFTNPAALWLLLLIPLLLLVHRHQPVSRRQVGTLRFWRESRPEQHTRLAPRPRLTRRMLLQAAFLGAVIVALASPTVAVGTRTIAIVVDLSLSMSAADGAQQRLDAAKAGAHAVLDRLPWGTRVRLVAADTPPRVVAEASASDSRLSDALDQLRATGAPADLEGALWLARDGERDPARTYVFSDAPRPASAGAGIDWTMVGQPVDNAAITALASRPAPSDPGAIDVLAEVTNFGSTAAASEIVLEMSGRAVWRQPLTVAPGERATAAARLPREPGVLTARFALADAIEADNLRYLPIRTPRSLRVRMIGRSYFLERALAAHAEVVIVDAEPFDVIVCAGCSETPPGSAGVILVPPASSALQATTPLVVTAATFAGAETVAGLDVSPLVSPRPAGEATVVARAAGMPAIVAAETEGRRIVELRIDVEAPSLALSPAFPVLVASALEWVAPDAGHALGIDAGDPLRRRVPGVQSATITAPEGPAETVATRGGLLFFSRTSRAGIYRVALAGREEVVAVNAAAGAESDLSAVPPAGSPGVPGEGGDDGDRVLRTGAAAGFLGLALALLAFEWHFGSARRRALGSASR